MFLAGHELCHLISFHYSHRLLHKQCGDFCTYGSVAGQLFSTMSSHLHRTVRRSITPQLILSPSIARCAGRHHLLARRASAHHLSPGQTARDLLFLRKALWNRHISFSVPSSDGFITLSATFLFLSPLSMHVPQRFPVPISQPRRPGRARRN